MIEVMLCEQTYRRVAQEFDLRANYVQPIVFENKDLFFRAGKRMPLDSIQPEIAWASADLFKGPAGVAREFMLYVLTSQSIRWLQSGAGGYDNRVFTMLAEKGIRLTRSDASRIAIAEFVLFSILNHYQSDRRRVENQKRKRWQRLEFREIYDTTWLIIGLGRIGAEISRRAKAFGAHTIGVKCTAVGHEQVDTIVRPKAMLSCVSKADVVVLCAPLNKETQALVDVEFLQRMKSDSVLVNVARGRQVDEDALITSLNAGRPALAVLDVFSTEPLPQDSPLWLHPRVRVTSHSAGAGSGSRARGDELFFDNLDRYLSKRTLRMEIEISDLES